MPHAISNADLGLEPVHSGLPVTVLLPGLDATLPVRMPFLERLGCQVPFLKFTLPPDRIASMEEAEAWFRERLPRDRPFVLAGYSYSGPVAIRIAADPPPNLVALILIATFARVPVPVPRPLALLAARPLFFRITAPRFLIRLLAGCDNPWAIEELQKAERAVRPEILAARLRACITVDVRQELMAVRVPILNVFAANDSVLPSTGEREISLLRPDARVTIIPGGHAILECTPKEAAHAITDFVTSLPVV